MRSANSSSKALQKNVKAHSSSVNSSPESKTTTAYSIKSLIYQKNKIGIIKRNFELYSKIDSSRSSLLLLASIDVSKKNILFEEGKDQTSFIIRQELDIFTNASHRHHSDYFSYHENEHSYIDYSSPGELPGLSQKRNSEKRRNSSKQLCFELFVKKRSSMIINCNSSLEEKKPFFDKLRDLACSLKSDELQRNNINKLDELVMLAHLIKGKNEKLEIRQKNPNFKYQKDILMSSNAALSNKSSSYKEANYRHSRKLVKSSQNLTNGIKPDNTYFNTSFSSKDKGNAIKSTLLVLIPCGTNQNNSESDHSEQNAD